MKTSIRVVSVVLLGASLVACNKADPQQSGQRDASSVASAIPAPPVCNDSGTITSIEELKVKGSGSGVGIVLGAVAGAVIGHQVGDGRGQDVATAAGAIGGGFAGNEIEKRVKGTSYFHVTVAMENGGTQTVDVEALNGLATGSKVKVLGSNLQLASS